MRDYVPVIKAKPNDLSALKTLSALAKARVFPLIESPILVSGGSLETRAVDAAHAAAKFLPDLPFYFDPLGIESSDRQLLAYQTLLETDAIFVPTFGLARQQMPLKALSTLVSGVNGRFAVRLEIADLDDADNTWDNITNLVSTFDVSSADVTIFLDFAQIGGKDLDQLKDLALDFLACQPRALAGLTIVLLGSSALHTVSDVPLDGNIDVARRELSLWGRLSFELADSRAVSFGDYGIVDPSFVFAGGPSGNANAKIRYTRGASTTYFRGHGLYNPNRFPQYHSLAQRVVESPVYMGENFSFGDKRISACAAHECGPGNLATWVRTDMNHHIEYTAAQIARLAQDLASVVSEAEVEDAIAQD